MNDTKRCPFCKALIHTEAIKCKHFRSMLNQGSHSNQPSDPFTLTKQAFSSKYEILTEIGRGVVQNHK